MTREEKPLAIGIDLLNWVGANEFTQFADKIWYTALGNKYTTKQLFELFKNDKTLELLKEANDDFKKCEHNEDKDPKTYANKEFIGYYCEKCDEVYCGSI